MLNKVCLKSWRKEKKFHDWTSAALNLQPSDLRSNAYRSLLLLYRTTQCSYKNSCQCIRIPPGKFVNNCLLSTITQALKHTSLNDCPLVGYTLNWCVHAILLCLCLHHYALSADIEKAFSMLSLMSRIQDFCGYKTLTMHDSSELYLTWMGNLLNQIVLTSICMWWSKYTTLISSVNWHKAQLIIMWPRLSRKGMHVGTNYTPSLNRSFFSTETEYLCSVICII